MFAHKLAKKRGHKLPPIYKMLLIGCVFIMGAIRSAIYVEDSLGDATDHGMDKVDLLGVNGSIPLIEHGMTTTMFSQPLDEAMLEMNQEEINGNKNAAASNSDILKRLVALEQQVADLKNEIQVLEASSDMASSSLEQNNTNHKAVTSDAKTHSAFLLHRLAQKEMENGGEKSANVLNIAPAAR